ncbi:MAG: CPBP family intramembrane metalloprotease [Candidatus Lokiarchaeota archaeon]|nr:CPBP family intramembrane metalloprotease [Candidatus Lokiarchaeota archaeon]
MSKNNEKKVKYCVYCGAEVAENKTYCPNCGKLMIKIESSKKVLKSTKFQKLEITRKCPECGSIITSTIIDQCPICDTPLEKISEVKKAVIQKKPGFIFTEKKLEPEQKFLLKKDTWNLKEGISVFGTCIYILVIVFFLLYTILSFQVDLATDEISIQQILLSQIPELLFGVYPIWYVYNKKHSFGKLGFNPESKKILIALLIGALGAIVLLLINYLSDSLISFLSNAGLDFFDIKESIELQNQIIRNADLLWIILLILALCIGTISSEIVFRGVLHNTLKQKFRNNFSVILIVALVYSLVMLLFSFPIGIGFFLANLVSFIILGFLYELNGNIFNTIIANLVYTIFIVLLIFL